MRVGFHCDFHAFLTFQCQRFHTHVGNGDGGMCGVRLERELSVHVGYSAYIGTFDHDGGSNDGKPVLCRHYDTRNFCLSQCHSYPKE